MVIYLLGSSGTCAVSKILLYVWGFSHGGGWGGADSHLLSRMGYKADFALGHPLCKLVNCNYWIVQVHVIACADLLFNENRYKGLLFRDKHFGAGITVLCDINFLLVCKQLVLFENQFLL